MEGKCRTQDLVRELPELSSSETRQGVLVRIRCVEIAGCAEPAKERARSPRYEIYMDARGHAAIADVPAGDRAQLASRIEVLVSAFVDSIALRQG